LHLYICADPGGGLRFNRRRQSRDSAVCADILRCADGMSLYMTESSRKLFQDPEENIICSSLPQSEAPSGAHCFAECLPLSPYIENFETITIYRWNRAYPADERLDFNPAEMGYHLTKIAEFSGTSHEIITKEVYAK